MNIKLINFLFVFFDGFNWEYFRGVVWMPQFYALVPDEDSNKITLVGF